MDLDEAGSKDARVSDCCGWIIFNFGESPRSNDLLFRGFGIAKYECGNSLFSSSPRGKVVVVQTQGKCGNLLPRASCSRRVVVGFEHTPNRQDAKLGFRVGGFWSR
jgi:hypothetical protein